MKTHARVVVIGGGVTGCSIAYHLAKMGWPDVVLLERKELASGSSWHAAGNLFALTAPNSVCVLQKYTIDLYPELERESDQSCGYHPAGGLHLARTEAQMDAFKLVLSRARRNNIDADFMSWEEATKLAPILNPEPFVGVLYESTKGWVDPSSVVQAFAKAARNYGATIYREAPVLETNPLPNGGWQVVTPGGTIEADVVVNAAGLWAREVAALAGIRLPLQPVEHQYLVTEAIPEIVAMGHDLPTITDSEASFYGRREGQGMLIGAYEQGGKHWATEGTPLDFDHELLADDLDRMMPNFERAIEGLPCLGQSGVKRVVNGPMIFSPDLSPLLGPYPGVKNYFCACGVMTGFNQGGGIGRTLAEWIIDGEPSLDLFCWDVTRFGDWASSVFTRARTMYFYENRMQRIYPYQTFEAGRPLQTTPIYDRLKAAGAVFGDSFGVEAPQWYARDEDTQADTPSFRRTNWFDAVGEECRAVRSGVGLFEISTFAKFQVSGAGAEDWLDHMLANRLPGKIGRTVLSPMLSDKGRLVGDFTVTRLAPDKFLMLGSGAMQRFHMRHFEAQGIPGDVTVENLTLRYTGLHIAGPKARALLAAVTEIDVGTAAFPFLSSRVIEVGGVPDVIVVRISFTGELGYEIYCPAEYQRTLFDALMTAGEPLGLRLTGSRAMMALRLEKGFPSWGLELGQDYTPFDAGLDRFVKLDKDDFVGKPAALVAQQRGAAERLVTFEVDVADTDAFGGEAVWRDGLRVGYVTSGGFGHALGKSLALGYVRTEHSEPGATYEIEILGELRPAVLTIGALHDPAGDRMRG